MKEWFKLQGRKVRNRVRAFRKSEAWDTFLGVFWALVAFELITKYWPVAVALALGVI